MNIISEKKKRYNKLTPANQSRINQVFDKIFGPSFSGYQPHMQKIVNKSNLSQKIYTQVEDELQNINADIINQIITASGPFDPNEDKKHCSNFSPSKKQKLSPAQELNSKRNGLYNKNNSNSGGQFHQYNLSPDLERKKAYMKHLIKLRPQDCIEQLQAAQELIKKLKKDKKGRMERFKKKEQDIKIIEEQEFQEIIKKRKEDEEKQKKELEQRREQIKLRLDLMREEREKRQQEWSNLRINHHLHQVNTPQPHQHRIPLYLELENKFKQTIELEEYQKRQRVFENLKLMKKPIDKEEIEEHAKKYEDEREKLLELKQFQREQKRIEQDNNFDPNKFKTKTYQEVALIDLQQKEEMETKEEMKKLLAEKKDSYARYVREMHLPPKSKAKEQELQELIQTLKHPVRSQVKLRPSTNVDGMQRSQSMNKTINDSHSHTRNTSSMSRSLLPGGESPRSIHTNHKNKQIRNNHNFLPSTNNKPPLPNSQQQIFHDQQQKPPKTDYLKERRLKRQEQEASGSNMPNRDTWLKNLSNKKLSKKEKFIKIKEKAREIEELALRKEQLLNLKNDPLTNSKNKNTYSNLKDEKNIEDTLEVNEMLIDAIKAKLAILDDIN